MSDAVKRPYHVNLHELLSLYESNYVKLLPLLSSEKYVGDISRYQLFEHEYGIEIIELTRYTTLICLFQNDENDIPLCQSPHLMVRLYHDAKMAEVLHLQQYKAFKATYSYPNREMHQQNEKQQVNQFLCDWLRYCLKYGTKKRSVS